MKLLQFRIIMLLLISLFIVEISTAQPKRVVVMGSSTADGANADPSSQAFVPKLQAHFRQNTSIGNPDTIVTEIAESGQATWNQMADGYVNLPGRPVVDGNTNVSEALSFNPTIIIINLPSNDVASGQYFAADGYPAYTLKETMDNYRLLFSIINAAGVRCFITTTQPRNDLDATRRGWQRQLKDSINLNFGVFAINFWDPLVTAAGNFLRDEVRDPTSDYHLNNVGHDSLFKRVRDKNIFVVAPSLPVKITDFRGKLINKSVVINWHSENEETFSFYEIQRSANGIEFETLHRLDAIANGSFADYGWTDRYPLAGNSFYRLKITEQARGSFSRVISIQNKETELLISRIYRDNASSELVAEISVQKDQSIKIKIINTAGIIVHSQTEFITSPSHQVRLPISKLPAGQYFLRVENFESEFSVRAFNK